MVIAGAAGYVAARYLLHLALIPSLILGTALTATSVGVAVAVWQELDALGSATGQLVVDVAELDDISGIGLMALLFALVPVLRDGHGGFWVTLGTTGGLFLAKLFLFAGLCYLFSQYLERGLIHLTALLEPAAGLMLTVLGLGLVIAALASWLGFSLAIGALFAGLVFSRDPEAVKTEASFNDLYAFFTPFFFVGIGMQIVPDSAAQGLGLGAVLLVAAIFGKLIGAGVAALLVTGASGALVLGISMIPRAEIAMVIVHQGHQLGEEAVPAVAYSAMVIVSAGSCILAPLALRPLLQRWPQRDELS
jgi:Kef-type K+ transport system membrane component KefB